MPITAAPYNNNVPAVTYNIGDVSTGSIIYASKWTEIYNTINTERARRGAAAIANPGFSGVIESNDLNTLTNGINYYWSDGIVSAGTVITASQINYLIDKVQYCGSVCICNCAYCTCNCNYCTCNCNYACTCNCNYSDERLKTNIQFLREENGIKIYSYNYTWNLENIEYGVIAQEILETEYRDAVGIDSDGYYFVNYAMLPKILERKE